MKRKIRIGGADTYALRGTTLITEYYPGPMRQNLRQDAELLMGKIDFGTFGSDENYSGPGTLMQALPDASRFQNAQIFEPPRAAVNKMFGIDDRQIASYQVEQLKNNPLSIFTDNPNGVIPGFECQSEPDNFSTLVNKRSSEFENFFTDFTVSEQMGQQVYPSYGAYEEFMTTNPNAGIVYNLDLNSANLTNPFISQGSSGKARDKGEYSGKCYSGDYSFAEKNTYVKADPSMQGNENGLNLTEFCIPDRTASFVNPLVLQHNFT